MTVIVGVLYAARLPPFPEVAGKANKDSPERTLRNTPMYAVFEDSGSQFKVSEGDIIRVDIRDLPENATELSFDRVLLVSDGQGKTQIGSPTVAKATVKADILTEVRGDKVVIIKYKHRKGYRRKAGHRQRFLRVKITGISA